MGTRNIQDYQGTILGTLTLPDTTSEATWIARLASYAVSPATTAAQNAAGIAAQFTEFTPTRTLNTVFQIDPTRAAFVYYTIKISCTATLTGGQTGTVQLVSDAVNPPTTIRGSETNTNSISLAIAITSLNEQTAVLSYMVPAGNYVKLVTSGTATITLVNQAEILINQA